ncbi:hypothetical protein [Phaffia rhodozyma]|uniref:DUF6699 domain-containing protein n=1 Tax=Phaffia rhodozyma TaxID=264483 RepID=A0A0F7SXM3_PHARH|nr:hypothetical protein [Phaffia rhodozyma]
MSKNLPRDVFLIIRDFCDLDIESHLNFCQASPWLELQIYPDRLWKKLIQMSGYSRSNHDLQGIQRARSWKSIAQELAVHPGGVGCEISQIIAVEPGSEGMLAKTTWRGVCECARDWNRRHYEYSTPIPPSMVNESITELLINPHLQPRSLSAEGFQKFNEHAIRPEELIDYAYDLSARDEVDLELIRNHPSVAHSYATYPPVTELTIWVGSITVSNPDGVTIWDVRQAILTSDRPRMSDVLPDTDPTGSEETLLEMSTSTSRNPFDYPSGEWISSLSRSIAAGTEDRQAWLQRQPGSVYIGRPNQVGFEHGVQDVLSMFSF